MKEVKTNGVIKSVAKNVNFKRVREKVAKSFINKIFMSICAFLRVGN